MFEVAFIGVGRVGAQALKYFLEEVESARVIALDSDPSRASLVRSVSDSVAFETCSSPSEALSKAGSPRLAVTALPSRVAFKYVEELIERGISVVDVSYVEEDPYSLEGASTRSRAFYVPDAGFAPGFSNLIVGKLSSELGELESLYIYAGGIPVEPVEPIGYQVTWNPLDLLEEYVRPARIVVDGAVKRVDPLEEKLAVEIPGVGVFEGFYSDGLRTLVRNVRAKNMAEVTIRHRGHLDAIRTLKKLGFLDGEPIEVSGKLVAPIEYSARVLERKLRQTVPDVAVLRVVASSRERRAAVTSILAGSASESATAKYTALVLAKTAAIAFERGLEPGVRPLEELYAFYDEYRSYLSSRGVEVREETSLR